MGLPACCRIYNIYSCILYSLFPSLCFHPSHFLYLNRMCVSLTEHCKLVQETKWQDVYLRNSPSCFPPEESHVAIFIYYFQSMRTYPGAKLPQGTLFGHNNGQVIFVSMDVSASRRRWGYSEGTGTSLRSWQCLMAWDAWGWWTVQISVITKCIFMSSLNVNLVYTSSAPWVCPESKPEVSISRQQVCPCCVHTAHSMAGP